MGSNLLQLLDANEDTVRARLRGFTVSDDAHIGVDKHSRHQLGHSFFPPQSRFGHSRDLTHLVAEEVLGPVFNVPERIDL